jgi:thioredoxin reductase
MGGTTVDLAVIGSGGAAFAAAIHASLSGRAFSGQLI